MDTEIAAPFPRLSYEQAMNLYGSDKPDTRFDMTFVDISEVVKGSDFKVFESVLHEGGKVKAINVKGYSHIPRRELDGLVTYVNTYGAKGLAWICYTEEGIKSPITKFFSTASSLVRPMALKTFSCSSRLKIRILPPPISVPFNIIS